MVIKAPNTQYAGVSAGVDFKNGIGETSDPYLISWFKQHGYEAAEELATASEEPIAEYKRKPQKKAGD